ncbi:hypothetical protein H7R52_16835 [Weissella confusa]|uniref:Uncharacterized protein n=1 Tax=Weissella confusa TaxID=1583 RepID=A0A923SP06_WEICO|nr:hypothetical protein [Weissella confusa]
MGNTVKLMFGKIPETVGDELLAIHRLVTSELEQPISMTFMYDGKLFDNENSCLTAFFEDVFDDQNIEIIRYTGQ